MNRLNKIVIIGTGYYTYALLHSVYNDPNTVKYLLKQNNTEYLHHVEDINTFVYFLMLQK